MYKLKMKRRMFLHQGLWQGAAMTDCCPKGRRGRAGVTAGQGAGGSLLSRRQGAERAVWVRVDPSGIGQDQSQSHDHRASPQGEGRSEVKPGSQANTECSQAVPPCIHHRLLNTKPLKNILSIILGLY